jgi:hypothetical protein
MMKSLDVKCKVIDCGNGMFGISVENVCVSEKEYRYLTRNRELVQSLADKINGLDVSPLHIEDIIDDFLE